jgi:hypothetical protein
MVRQETRPNTISGPQGGYRGHAVDIPAMADSPLGGWCDEACVSISSTTLAASRNEGENYPGSIQE